MWLAFSLSHGPKGSGDDQECIFFTLNTYQPTFFSGTLSYAWRNWKLKSGTWRNAADADANAIRTDRHEGLNSYVSKLNCMTDFWTIQNSQYVKYHLRGLMYLMYHDFSKILPTSPHLINIPDQHQRKVGFLRYNCLQNFYNLLPQKQNPPNANTPLFCLV